MKKLAVVFLLLFSLSVFGNSYGYIEIHFLNGDVIKNTADSFWTTYNRHDSYYEYYEDDKDGKQNNAYITISDYVTMNPVSRETKKDDFRHIRDKVETQGHWAHYFDKQGLFTDQWDISSL